VVREQDQLNKMSQLFAEGLISKKELEATERTLGAAKDKVTEVTRQSRMRTRVSLTRSSKRKRKRRLLEPKPIPKVAGKHFAMIRYNGATAWSLSDAWKVQTVFSWRI